MHADSILVESYIDLLYREDDSSLVIIDYKTDDVPETALRHGAPSTARSCARTGLLAVGLTVSRSVLLFTTSTGATCVTV